MHGTRSVAPAGRRDSTDQLDRLLDAEARLATRLADARAEAERVLEAARAEIARAEQEDAALLAARLGELEERLAVELQGELAELANRSEAEASRYRELDEDTRRSLRTLIVERVLAVSEDER